ncbi:MAG: pilus assembly protein PilM [Candidatus Omnitrophota bacterium]|jgi:type IV pilus assembly protein PilM
MSDQKPKGNQGAVKPAKPKSSSHDFWTVFAASFQNFIASGQHVIGIDIGSSHIKVLQLQKISKGYLITDCVIRSIPLDIREDALAKKKLIQDIIKKFIAESPIKTRFARLAISGKGIFVFSLSVPVINKKDLRGLIGLELKKRMPFQVDINNVSFDFFITGRGQDDKGPNLQVTCIAVDRLALDEQMQFLKDINIRPVAINIIPDALGNLVSFCVEAPANKTVMLLDVGANNTTLNFYKGRDLVFMRDIPVGGDHLTRAMAKPIDSGSQTIELSFDDAEKIKRNCGIPLEDESRTEFLTDYGALLGEQISTMFRPTLERLIMEITRTVSYYAKTFKAENIEELYITGGSSRLKNLDKFFLYNLERLKKVERLNVLKTIKGWTEKGVLKQDFVMEQAAPHLAVAFGLCLGSGGKINLLPNTEKLEQKTLFLRLLLRLFFPVTLLLFLVMHGFSYLNNVRYKSLIQATQEEILRLEPTVAQVRGYLDMKTRLDQRKDLLEKAIGKQPLWWGVFKELSNITPKNVVLSMVSTEAAKEPKEIRLRGRIVSQYTIVDLALSQYQMVLEESPFFKDVVLVASEPDKYSSIPAATFEITCKLEY